MRYSKEENSNICASRARHAKTYVLDVVTFPSLEELDFKPATDAINSAAAMETLFRFLACSESQLRDSFET